MKKLTMEGVNCIYLFKGDDLNDKMNIEGLEIADFPPTTREVIDLKIKQNESIRIVLVESRKAFEIPVLETHILLSQNEAKIKLIDQNILVEKYSDYEFADTILTKYQKTFCTYCNWFGDTLVVHIDTMNPQLHRVLRDKIEKWELKTCPNCTQSLRQPVVHIF